MPEIDPHTGEANPEVHHEHSDINVKPLLWSVAIFVALAIVMHVALWGLHAFFAKEERESQAPPTTMVRRDAPSLPPEPRLQPFPAPQQGRTGAEEPATQKPVVNPLSNTPVFDMQQMIEEEERHLSEYGWADRAKGAVRIPIADAKKLLVARGLPVRQAVAPQPGAPAAAAPSGSAPVQPSTAAPAQTSASPTPVRQQ